MNKRLYKSVLYMLTKERLGGMKYPTRNIPIISRLFYLLKYDLERLCFNDSVVLHIAPYSPWVSNVAHHIARERALEWHVCMFFPWHMCFLGGQQFQILTNPPPRRRGFNDVIHIATHCRWERVTKLLNVLLMVPVVNVNNVKMLTLMTEIQCVIFIHV